EGCRGARVRRPAGLRRASHRAAGASCGREPRVSWQDDLAAIWDDESIDDLERVERMALLAPTAPHPALGLFELASAHDGAGLEAEALVPTLPMYRRALTDYAAMLTENA